MHGLADKFVRAYDDVYLALGKVGKYGLGVLGRAGSRQIFDTHRKIFEAFAEGVVMLICKDRGGHQYGGLLAIHGSFEGCAHGYLGLAKAHVAAYQAVHGSWAFHV